MRGSVVPAAEVRILAPHALVGGRIVGRLLVLARGGLRLVAVAQVVLRVLAAALVLGLKLLLVGAHGRLLSMEASSIVRRALATALRHVSAA
jgi:hypothetical protein